MRKAVRSPRDAGLLPGISVSERLAAILVITKRRLEICQNQSKCPDLAAPRPSLRTLSLDTKTRTKRVLRNRPTAVSCAPFRPPFPLQKTAVGRSVGLLK